MSLRCTGLVKRCGSSWETTAPAPWRSSPLRFCLYTARKTQPCPWKSANCVRELGVQVGDVGEELGIGPLAAHRRALGVAVLDLGHLARGGAPLRLRVHERAVRLVVPPGVAVIAVGDRRARVVMADHALARGNRAGE